MEEMHAGLAMNGALILLVFLAIGAGAMLYVLHLTRAGVILHERIPDRPRRRLFLAAVSFCLTFLSVRGLMLAIYFHLVPFSWVEVGGVHVHHLVWGIVLLLVSGYGMVAEWGTRATPLSLLASRLVSILYGMGAALTLDEFEMWLTVRDSAWTFGGRTSLDAVLLFAILLAGGAWGAPLWTQRTRKATHNHHRKPPRNLAAR